MIIAYMNVGLHAARIAATMPRLVTVDADWIERSEYGWNPIRQIFQLAWVSMALYGLLVSGLALVLGLGSFGWIPAAMWLVFLIVYFGIPWWFTVRNIETTAKNRRIDLARAEYALEDATTEVGSVLLPFALNLAQPYIESLIPVVDLSFLSSRG